VNNRFAETVKKTTPLTGIYRGLCLTCKQANTCSFPRDFNRPILQCEEFDGYVLPKISKETPFKASLKTVSGSRKKEVAKHTGLCTNCENRKTCTYPKTGKTIWCCEEYE